MNLIGKNVTFGPVVAGVVLLGVGAAFGQAVKFEPTLLAGKRYTVKMEQKGSSKMAMGDVQMDQKVDMLMVNVMEAKKADEGDVAVSMKNGRLKLATEVLGQKMEFDSDSPETAHPMLGGMMKSLADSEVSAVVKPDGTLADVKLSGGASGGGSPLGDMGLGPEMMEAMVKGYLGEGFPKEAVEPGAEWDHGVEVPMAQMKGRKVATHYKFEGMEAPEGSEKKLAKVSFKGTLGEAPEGEESKSTSLGGLNVSIEISELTMEGVMYYDVEKRFFTVSKSTSKMVMGMNNGETTMEIPTTQDQVTVLEKLEDL